MTAIVVDMTTTVDPISSVDNVATLIVAKSEIESNRLAALAVGVLTDTSAELLRSFVSEASVDRLRLLAFEQTAKLFLFKKSLKKVVMDSIVSSSSVLPLRTNLSRSFLWYNM